MNGQTLGAGLLELIARGSSDLPGDVEAAIIAATDREDPGSGAREAMGAIVENVRLARAKRTPICQDTGMLTFFVHHPLGVDPRALTTAIHTAIRTATDANYLRPNAVDVLTNRNSGDNIGGGFPILYFEPHDGDTLEVDLIMKGGGCENVGDQRRLPDTALKAGRDLEGVRRLVVDMVHNAQGFGCAPGVVGIGLGGDRAGSYGLAKKQLLRRLDDHSPDASLAALEERLASELNELGVGPMGFGGRTTVLAVKVGAGHRHPATFYVSMAYFCWAARRRHLTVRADGSWQVD